MALEVERRLTFKHHRSTECLKVDLVASDIDETLIKGAVECSVFNCDTSAAVDSLLDDNVSTLKEDVVDKIDVIRTIDEDIEKLPTTEETQIKQKPSYISPLFLNIDPNLCTFNTDDFSPSFSLHTSPSLGALDESRNQSLYFTPMSGRDSFSPAPNDEFPMARLIRSNSYTLEKPSPLLIKHMEANCVRLVSNGSPLKSPMSLNDVRKNRNSTNNTPRKSSLSLGAGDAARLKDQKSKNNSTKATTNKSLNKTISSNSTIVASSQRTAKYSSPYAMKPNKVQKSATKPKTSNQFSGYKNREALLRSIYGTGKLNKTSVTTKKANGSKPPTDSIKTSSNPDSEENATNVDLNKTASNMKLSKNVTNLDSSRSSQVIEPISSQTFNGNICAKNYQDILALIEHQHTTQMNLLLQRQQDEQKRMQHEFLRQQEELLKKISNLVINKLDKQSTPKQTTANPTEPPKMSNGQILIEEVNSDQPDDTLDTNGNRVNRIDRFTPEGTVLGGKNPFRIYIFSGHL